MEHKRIYTKSLHDRFRRSIEYDSTLTKPKKSPKKRAQEHEWDEMNKESGHKNPKDIEESNMNQEEQLREMIRAAIKEIFAETNEEEQLNEFMATGAPAGAAPAAGGSNAAQGPYQTPAAFNRKNTSTDNKGTKSSTNAGWTKVDESQPHRWGIKYGEASTEYERANPRMYRLKNEVKTINEAVKKSANDDNFEKLYRKACKHFEVEELVDLKPERYEEAIAYMNKLTDADDARITKQQVRKAAIKEAFGQIITEQSFTIVNNDNIDKIADYIAKYRTDKTMTPHRIARDILRIIENMMNGV